MSLPPEENPLIKILSRDPAKGGVLTLIQGKPGSGKTSLLLYLISKKIYDTSKKLYEHDILIWRGMYSCEFQRYPDQSKIIIHFLEHDFQNTKFYDKRTEKEIDIEDQYKVKIARDIINLYYNLKRSKGNVNVLYLYRSDWYDFFEYIVYIRPDMEWISLFFDEFRDIAPPYPNKIEFEYLLRLEPIIREIRKMRISLYVGVHMNTDIYYLIKEKFQYWIYLAGAKRPKYTEVYQKAINSLKPGQAIVDDFNRYVWLEFPQIGYETQLKMVNLEWVKRMKNEIHRAAKIEIAQTKQKTKKIYS
mgnify:CR=1 FL=1